VERWVLRAQINKALPVARQSNATPAIKISWKYSRRPYQCSFLAMMRPACVKAPSRPNCLVIAKAKNKIEIDRQIQRSCTVTVSVGRIFEASIQQLTQATK